MFSNLVLCNFLTFNLTLHITVKLSLPQSTLIYILQCITAFSNHLFLIICISLFISHNEFINVHKRLRSFLNNIGYYLIVRLAQLDSFFFMLITSPYFEISNSFTKSLLQYSDNCKFLRIAFSLDLI